MNDGSVTTLGLSRRKLLVAHRGASAYAPEHTLAAYRLALAQQADYVEQDLAVTSDGVLICLHDPSLERTTDVRRRFPDRWREIEEAGTTRRTWLANDFTLDEIRDLDAGSWFGPAFAGERVATFQEAIDLVKGKAGLFPELKDPELYAARRVDFEGLVEQVLRANGLAGPSADPATPVILQTFSPSTVNGLERRRLGLPILWLVEEDTAGTWTRERVLAAQANGATALGPDKRLVSAQPDLVGWARESGMLVIPYTFCADDTPHVTADMRHFLYTLGVDGLFTDNPDLFPR